MVNLTRSRMSSLNNRTFPVFVLREYGRPMGFVWVSIPTALVEPPTNANAQWAQTPCDHARSFAPEPQSSPARDAWSRFVVPVVVPGGVPCEGLTQSI